MTASGGTILALNPGSSSLKAALRDPELLLSVGIERLGTAGASLTVAEPGSSPQSHAFTGDLAMAVDSIAALLRERAVRPDAVVHRVVHGGPEHYLPTVVDDGLLSDLEAVIPLAPLHLPGELASIGHARRAWPDATHVACFDTGFHHDLPESSRRLPVAAELTELGVRRYGFHGLSIQSILRAVPDIDQAVIAHLGSGCSVTAVAHGRPRHTTMSLTPTGGMVSGTRSGDLDPEIVLYLIEEHGYSVEHLRTMLDRDSGIAGVAEGRHDLRDLEEADPQDLAAALALEIFVRSAAGAIAICATTLDRWETLVFTGGVGEHLTSVRDRICQRLAAVRADMPATRGAGLAQLGGVDQLRGTGLRVLVVPADEQAVMDGEARTLLNR